MKYCIKHVNEKDSTLTERAVVSLKHMLDVSKCYISQGLKINGDVHLLRPSIMDELDDCNLKQVRLSNNCEKSFLKRLFEKKKYPGDDLHLIVNSTFFSTFFFFFRCVTNHRISNSLKGII